MTTIETPALFDMERALPACESCGEEFEPADGHTTQDGKTVCGSDVCSIDCDLCGERTSEGEWFTVDGEAWCQSCVDTDAVWCSSCEEYTREDDSQTVRIGYRRTDTEIWCDACVDQHSIQCDGCSEHQSTKRGHERYMTACTSCGVELCESCSECMYGCDSCDAYMCDGCGTCSCSNSAYVRHDNPTMVYHRAPGELPRRKGGECHYFGVELELTGDYSMADALIGEHFKGSERDWFAKEDGSVQGVEFVSMPRTLASWQAFDLQAMMRALDDAGAEDGNDGLHIHASRHAWRSGNHVRRTVELMTQGEDNIAFAEFIAGRSECSWANFNRVNTKAVAMPSDYYARRAAGDTRKAIAGVGATTNAYGERVRSGGRGMVGGDRYSVLNMCNRNTIEWRLGCSTLDATQLMAAVEYYAASIEYTRTLSLMGELLDGLHVSALLDFVADNMEIYPHLAQRVVEFSATHAVCAEYASL